MTRALFTLPNRLLRTFGLAALGFLTAGQVSLLYAGEASLPRLEILLRENTPLPDGSTLANFQEIAINNNGRWFAEVQNFLPGDQSFQILIIDGDIALRKDVPMVPGPPGSTLAAFDDMSLNNNGIGAFSFFLGGVPETARRAFYAHLDLDQSFDQSAVLMLQQGDPIPGLPPEDPFEAANDSKVNDNGDIFANLAVLIDGNPKNIGQFLMTLKPDPTGGIASSEIIARAGEALPGQIHQVLFFPTGFEDNAFNDQGHLVFIVNEFISQLVQEYAVYLYDGQFTEIAREGRASPVPGRNWGNLFRIYLTLNNADSYAMLSELDGDEESQRVIIKDGRKLAQTGDTLPSIAPFELFDITGPIFISDDGDVYWYGSWDDPDLTRNDGLFVNDQLLVQEGVSQTVDGTTVLRLFSTPERARLRVSDDGGQVVMLATLTGGDEALLRLVPRMFDDGFESGNTANWSTTVGAP